MKQFRISANLIDVWQQSIYAATLHIEDGVIRRIVPWETTQGVSLPDHFILPGFVDAHVHIESSMLVPSEFARLAVVHGTVATVSDPHEIGNVLGVQGVELMLGNSRKVSFKFSFGAPSCVPATAFETAGAAITPEDVASLLRRDDIRYLSEMMNFPGVLNQDPEVMQKLAIAAKSGKPVDGHAPGLRGEQARRYIEAGISTDHECFTREEALDKLKYGMKILIREGSAARNFEALISLLSEYPEELMFCSDDKHPDSLVEGHINELVKRALAKGIPLFHVLRAACVNPVLHYKLPVGLLREGDPADFILIDDPGKFNVLATYVNGTKVAEQGKTLIRSVPCDPLNRFECRKKEAADFGVQAPFQAGSVTVPVIEALDGQLITNKQVAPLPVKNGLVCSDPVRDVLKITVVNRYRDMAPATAFICGFGLRQGALASSVAHDSHNIIAVGTDDILIAEAVNLLVENRGGICVVTEKDKRVLPLPVAGLMSCEDGYRVAEEYASLDSLAKELGSGLAAPFMTLSFMALLVIPHLKLSDRGLFDGDGFCFVPVLMEDPGEKSRI